MAAASPPNPLPITAARAARARGVEGTLRSLDIAALQSLDLEPQGSELRHLWHGARETREGLLEKSTRAAFGRRSHEAAELAHERLRGLSLFHAARHRLELRERARLDHLG